LPKRLKDALYYGPAQRKFADGIAQTYAKSVPLWIAARKAWHANPEQAKDPYSEPDMSQSTLTIFLSVIAYSLSFVAKAVSALKQQLAAEEYARPPSTEECPLTAVEFIRQGLQLQERQYVICVS
jgi:hypothetical protein